MPNNRIHATLPPALARFIEAASAAHGVQPSAIVTDLLARALGTKYPDPQDYPELFRRLSSGETGA